MMKVGILGCGVIARKMANTLRMMRANGEDVCLYAAAARDLQRAQAFCEAEGFAKAYGSYEALAQDENVDLIYIATPHSHHYDHMKLCLSHGRAVLCEKAFTLNAAQAREVLELARQKNLLLCEAMWTRFLPVWQVIRDVMFRLGKVQFVSADVHFPAEGVERISNPALAGGALLDVGVYSLTVASMVLGDDFERMDTSVQLLSTGVDRQESISLYYPNGAMAQLTAGVAACGANRALIGGDRGSLHVENTFNPQKLTLYADGSATDIPVPPQLTGYEYEVRACMKALQEGRIECPEMPHSETIRIMEIMDELRRRWGVVYPQEA